MSRRVGIVAFALVVVTAAVGATTAGALTRGKVIQTKLNEYNVLTAKQSAPAGKVTFVVKNIGKIVHEFVVVKTDKPAGNLLGGDHGPNRADESGSVGEIEELKPGETKRLTVTLKKGHYALLCNLPGHYKAGQYIDFYVG
jgi:uncharacterized cupredoxin-like copper-binding protein